MPRVLPNPTSLSRPFWDATRERRFVLQRCSRCGEFVWTPQAACRSCLTETLEWTDVSGKGTVYSFVVIHRSANPSYQAPYTIVVIELDEGPRILSDLIRIDPADVKIGMRVEVEFEDAGAVGLYHFRPAGGVPAGPDATRG